MKILIVSATEIEQRAVKTSFNKLKRLKHEVHFLCTGPSVPMTTFEFTNYISDKEFDLYINAGICGSFKNEYTIGTVLNIVQDRFADIGIAHKNKTISLFDTDFWTDTDKIFSQNGCLVNETNVGINLPKVSAITVNVTSGQKLQIKERTEKYNADTESMEGAAFAYVCEKKKLNYLQIRAVSNKVEERNPEKWNIPLALKKLADSLILIISDL